MAHPVQIKRGGRAVQQLDLVGELLVEPLADQSVQVGIAQLHLGGGGRLGSAVGGEVDNLAAAPVIYALEVLAAADGPVHRVGLDAQLLLQLLQQLEGVPRLPIHLVDKGEDGDVPHGAHLEQLAGLGLHALGRINDHHRAVRGHEGAVGVLGEVLVAGGVQDVDAVALVLELHDGGGGPGVLFALDLPGLGNGPAVEQELFGQGGLAGVRVADDGKGTPAIDFFLVL